MKKYALGIAALGIAVMGAGCGSAPDEDSQQSANSANQINLTVSNEEQGQENTMVEEKPAQQPIERSVTLKTNKGDIKLELFLDDAPKTATNFLNLAKSGFYDGVKFHRIIAGFMIQGGDPLSKDDNPDNDGTGGPGYFIDDEFFEGSTNVRGSISMANAGPNTGGSQFFINLGDNTNLDYDKPPASSKHPVFGKVVQGMDVVDAIASVQTTGTPYDRPLEDVVIIGVSAE